MCFVSDTKCVMSKLYEPNWCVTLKQYKIYFVTPVS